MNVALELSCDYCGHGWVVKVTNGRVPSDQVRSCPKCKDTNLHTKQTKLKDYYSANPDEDKAPEVEEGVLYSK
jgi:hypothetical protein